MCLTTSSLVTTGMVICTCGADAKQRRAVAVTSLEPLIDGWAGRTERRDATRTLNGRTFKATRADESRRRANILHNKEANKRSQGESKPKKSKHDCRYIALLLVG